MTSHLSEHVEQGCSDGSAFESTCCPRRGLGFNSRGILQHSSYSPAPQHLIPLITSTGSRHAWRETADRNKISKSKKTQQQQQQNL